MKREFLKSLGLDGETLEKILAEHQKDVSAQESLAKAEHEKLEAANKAVSDLQAAAKQYEGVDVAGLQAELAGLQKRYDADMKRQKVDAAVTLALTSAGAKNVKAARALLEIDPEKAEFDEAGNLKGLEDSLQKLRGAEDSRFLFHEKDAAPQWKGLVPGAGKDGPSDGADVSQMTYSEMCSFFAENPDTAL